MAGRLITALYRRAEGRAEHEADASAAQLRELIATFALSQRVDEHPDRLHADSWSGSGVSPATRHVDEGWLRVERLLPSEAVCVHAWCGYPHRVVWRVPSALAHVTYCEGDLTVQIARSFSDLTALDASARRLYEAR